MRFRTGYFATARVHAVARVPSRQGFRFQWGFMRLLPVVLFLGALARAEDPLEALLEEANSDSWARRWHAVQGLARLSGDDRLFRVRGLLLRDERPRVRAAIAWAALLDPALANATLLGLVVRKDPDPEARRGAARALVHFKDRRAVDALVEALAGEKDPRTRLFMVETLRELTPAPCLLDAEAWKRWWAQHRQDPRFRPADEAVRRGEYEGIPLETRTVAPVPGPGANPPPSPLHILVLPGFGWSTAAYGPYLLPLRDLAALTWVRLPTVQALTGRSGYGDDIPVYPVDRLVRALDAFRASLGLERFLVLAPGASGWIAMRYAVRYPDRCAGLVLLDTALDKDAYGAALSRAAARGTPGERFTASTLLHRNGVPFSEATLDRLQAYGLERAYRDHSELEIAWLYHRARDPQGFATVPDIAWSRNRRVDVPALFFYSAASAFSAHHDADRIREHFPRSLVAPLGEAAGLPYVETQEEFHRVLRHFLARFGLAG